MKQLIEKLNNNLDTANSNLVPVAEATRFLLDTGVLEQLASYLPEVISFIRRTIPAEEPKLFMADVIHYLSISERTYYRKLAEGKLKPRKWEGPDFFYRRDLEEELRESRRRGRT